LTSNYTYSKPTSFGWIPQKHWVLGAAFALDNNDVPNVLYRAAPDYPIMYTTQAAPNLWNFQKVVDGPVSENMKLLFDSQNRPNVAFVDTALQRLRLAILDGGLWSFRTVDTAPQFQYGTTDFLFDLGPDDKPHFSWHDSNDEMMYARPNDSNGWDIEDINGIADAHVSDMKVDSLGRVHLVYDLFTGSVHTGGLHYGVNDSEPTWHTERINGLLNFGQGEHTLSIDTENKPHIFTLDSAFLGPDILKHISPDGVGWTIDTVDSWSGIFAGLEAISAEINAYGIHVLYVNDAQDVQYAFKAIPEPAAMTLLTLSAAAGLTRRKNAC
jgi:hypothetical protein